MAFDTDREFTVSFHPSAKSVLSDSTGYTVVIGWETKDIIQNPLGSDMAGQTILVSLKGNYVGLNNFILDIPSQMMFFLDYAGDYRIVQVSITNRENESAPYQISWNGSDSHELDTMNTRNIVDIIDDILRLAKWDTKHEIIKGHLIGWNLHNLV